MNKRLLRINSLIRDELSNILLREVEFPESVLATITRVEVSDDLFNVNVYISVIPDNKRERVFEILNKLVYFIQQKLNKRLRVRPIPKILNMSIKLSRLLQPPQNTPTISVSILTQEFSSPTDTMS